jgi:hypothetical protein
MLISARKLCVLWSVSGLCVAERADGSVSLGRSGSFMVRTVCWYELCGSQSVSAVQRIACHDLFWSRYGLQCIRHPLKWFFGTRSCADVFQSLSWRSRCLQMNMESYDTGSSSLLHDFHRCCYKAAGGWSVVRCMVQGVSASRHVLCLSQHSLEAPSRIANRSATTMRCCLTSCILASGSQPLNDYRPDTQWCRTIQCLNVLRPFCESFSQCRE